MLQPTQTPCNALESVNDVTQETIEWLITGYNKSIISFQKIEFHNLVNTDLFPSVLWHCWLGDRNGIRPVKKTGYWFVGGDDLTGALHDL